jgi:hypothetical protein
MTLIQELLKGKFHLPCSEIRLRREKGPALEIAGPGVIEISAEGKFRFTIHVSAEDHGLMFCFIRQNIPTLGFHSPGEHFFQLIATSESEGVWHGRVTTLYSGGELGEPGLVGGTLSELRSERDGAQTDSDWATLFLPRQLDFPALKYTERTEIRKSSLCTVSFTRDKSKFTIDAEEFVLSHKENHTELECRFELGSIDANRHRRMQEALGFALCRPIWTSAMILRRGGKRIDILQSPDQLPTAFKVSNPPLHFNNLPLESGQKVFEIVAAYYRKTIERVSEEEHPISSGVFLVMQALQSYVDVEILALGVAAEALIKTAFPGSVVVEQEFKDELAKFNGLLQELDLSDKVKNRIKGATERMLSSSTAELFRNFVVKSELDPGLLKAWNKARNTSAHGKFIDLSKFPQAVERRNKVLYLCHAIVLAFIGYSGPHTRYDLPGYPVAAWKAST